MNASPHSCFIASLIDLKLPRKVRHLLFKEKLKKGAAKGREQAAEGFENQICRLGDRDWSVKQKKPRSS
jgi:hypothetical protein